MQARRRGKTLTAGATAKAAFFEKRKQSTKMKETTKENEILRFLRTNLYLLLFFSNLFFSVDGGTLAWAPGPRFVQELVGLAFLLC
jgi:hypothetical protein